MMKIIITSLLIGSLFIFSEAGLSMVKSPIDEEDPRKRTVAVDILNSPTVSKIKITSAYSENEGLKITCDATGENLSYDWSVQNGTLLNNEVAAENVLSIHHVTKENDRIFCCKAFNTVDSLTKCIRLPVLVLTSDPLVRIVDSSAEMFCEVIGTDRKFDIKWKRADGLPLPNNTIVNGGFLKIPKLATTDTGIYVCVGLYKGKTEAFHPEISLKVVSRPEIVDVTITGLDGDFDNNVTIQCITQPDANITYKWKAHTEGCTEGGPYLRTNEKADGNSLSIHNFEKDNEGTYCCVATNALGTEEKCVTIEPLVLEVYPKESYEVMSGDSVTLECRESSAHSNVKIDWTREDGQQFDPNVSKFTNGSLTIKNVTIRDEGRYNCSATKGVLSTLATIEIKVKTLPVVKIMPRNDGNITAKLGDNVKLICTADGHPQPNVQWEKFSPIANSYQTGTPVTPKSAVYDIMSLSEDEVGLYRCLAENSAGFSNKTVQVVIKPPLLEVYPNESQKVMSGDSVTLECRESVGYSGMKIDWERIDGQPFAPNVVKLANGSLTITNIQINEEGLYKCSVTNGVASASATADITVKSPLLSEIKISKLGYRYSSKLTCEATGENVSYNWIPETGALLKNEVAKENILTIDNLTEDNYRLFCCEASNAAGTRRRCERLLEVLGWTNYEKKVGTSVELECTIYGPVPHKFDFKWSRENGLPLPKDATTAGYRLKIPKLAESDAGIYFAAVDWLRETIPHGAGCKIPLTVRT